MQSKMSHALQNDYSMEIFRKLIDSLCKKSMNFPCSLQNFSQVFVLHLSKKKIESHKTFWWFQKTFLRNNEKMIYFKGKDVANFSNAIRRVPGFCRVPLCI